MSGISDNILEINYHIAEVFRNFANYNYLDTFLIYLAEYGAFVIPLVLLLMFFANSKYRKASVFILITTVIAIELSYIAGLLYYHPRPFEIYETLLSAAPGNTFPSQHASTMFAVFLASLYRQKLIVGAIFGFFALVNSFARIAVGFHFPLDILGGLAVALIALAMTGLLEEYIDSGLNKIERRLEAKNLNYYFKQ